MSRSVRLMKGLGALYTGQLLILLIGFWATRFILDHLGKADYGLWLIGQQILIYVTLAEFGLIAIIPREIGGLMGGAGEDYQLSLQDYINRTAHLLLWLMPVVVVAAVGSLLFLPDKWAPLRGPLAFVLIGYTILFPFKIFSAALQGIQDLAFVNVVGTAKWLLSTVLSIGLLAVGFDLQSLAWGWLAGESIAVLVFGLRLWLKFPFLLPRRLPPLKKESTRRQLVDGFWVTLQTIAYVLFTGTDIFLIGQIYGPNEVLSYSCTTRLIQLLGNYAHAALVMSLPALSEVRGKESPQQLREVCNHLILGQMLLSGGVACVLFAVNGAFIVFWLKDSSLFGGTAINVALLVVMLMRHWSSSLLACLFAAGRVARISLTQIADGLLTVACSWFFLHWLGPIGAPLGSLLGVSLITLPLFLFGVAASLHTTPVQLLYPLRKWFARFLPLAMVSALVGVMIPIHSMRVVDLGGVVIGISGVIAVIYCLIMIHLLQDTPLARFVPKPLARLLGN